MFMMMMFVIMMMDTIRAEKLFVSIVHFMQTRPSLPSFNYAYRCKPGRYEVLSISFSRCLKQTQGGKGQVSLSTCPSLKYVVFSSWTIVPPPPCHRLSFLLPRHQEREGKCRILLTLLCNSKSKTERKTLPFFDFAYSF